MKNYKIAGHRIRVEYDNGGKDETLLPNLLPFLLNGDGTEDEPALVFTNTTFPLLSHLKNNMDISRTIHINETVHIV